MSARPGYAADCHAHARQHADQAAKLLNGSEKGSARRDIATAQGVQAGAHATLAVYWQREADRTTA